MNILYILLIYILCMSLSLLEDTMSYKLYSLWSAHRLYSLRFMFSKDIISKIYSIFSIGWGIPGVAVVFVLFFLGFLPSFQTRIPNTESQHGRPQAFTFKPLQEDRALTQMDIVLQSSDETVSQGGRWWLPIVQASRPLSNDDIHIQ